MDPAIFAVFFLRALCWAFEPQAALGAQSSNKNPIVATDMHITIIL
jgi:hypothetical protein